MKIGHLQFALWGWDWRKAPFLDFASDSNGWSLFIGVLEIRWRRK